MNPDTNPTPTSGASQAGQPPAFPLAAGSVPAGRVRIRKTPNCLHAYTATVKGKGTYGWGNTPAEARQRLAENLKNES